MKSEKLNDAGMVCHFDELKESIGKWISENLDHTMLLSQDDPILSVLKEKGERVFVMDKNPTAENIAKLIYDKASSMGIGVSRVEVWESDTARAAYS